MVRYIFDAEMGPASFGHRRQKRMEFQYRILARHDSDDAVRMRSAQVE